jgi:hypothetical protein
VTFENLCVHLAITRLVATVATGRIDHAFTTDRAVCGIEAQVAAFDPKGAMRRMEQGGQGEVNVALGWVQFKDSLRLCERSG